MQPLSRKGVGPSCVALPEGPWPTIAAFLRERFARVSGDEWRSRMQRGDVFDAQGQAVDETTPYAPHAKVWYFRDPPPEPAFPIDETVLFQDEFIVVADKPHYMPVTPSGRYLQQTLLVRLKRRLGLDTLAPVHRIDRDTAGLVLFTVKPETRGTYQALFRERTARKHYEAIAPVNPALHWPMTHRSRLAEGESFMTMREVPGEPNSDTVIDLLASRNGLGLFGLQPLSGKRHQLRAHMSALGMPLVNDGIYPTLMPELETPDFAKPLQLVARRLSFTDPVTGVERAFESAYRLELPA
jgi:tRNA pseudouridine32 synthase/23S rRNA pseudouridine746 synthase